MTNIEALLTLVRALPEIELQSLLEGVAEHCQREKLTRVVDFAFGEDDMIDRDEYDELETKYEDLQDDNARLERQVGELETEIEKLKEKKS